MPPRHRGPGRADDQRVPRPPRTSAGQHHPQPQRPAGRDPLPVQLRRAASSRARRRHRPGAGDTAQTQRPDDRHLPQRAPRPRPCCRPRPGHPDRAPRPRLDLAGDRDRAAGLGADRADPPRCPSRRRRLRRLPRQRPQGPDHAAAAPTVAVLRAWLPNDRDEPPTRSSPPSAAGRSAETPSNAAHSPSTARQPPRPARRCLGKKPAPHVLRHSCAVQLRRAGIDSGHTRAMARATRAFATTDIYQQLSEIASDGRGAWGSPAVGGLKSALNHQHRGASGVASGSDDPV